MNPVRIVAAVLMMGFAGTLAAQSLDYEVFKTRVQPIFSERREGHARCVVCHAESNNAFHLQPWGPETTAYTEEQSRKNFETVSKLVNLKDPEKSMLLLHPLAKDAGGHEFHSGGRQFMTKSDPDWKILEEWVHGAK